MARWRDDMHKRQKHLVMMLRERDEMIRRHHEVRTGRKLDSPFTLDGQAADEIERLRSTILAALEQEKLEQAVKRIADLEAALVNLIDAIDEKDAAKIETALFVGRGLTF